MDINEKYQAQLKMLTNALIDFKKSLDADMGKYDELEQNWCQCTPSCISVHSQ